MKYKSNLIILGLIVVSSVFANLLAPFSFETQNLDRVLLSPNFINWFGTDELGRDLFSRILYGGRISLLVALGTSLFCMILGSLWGIIAGYFGGIIDALLMRLADLVQAIPTLVLMILFSVIFNSKSLWAIIISIGLVNWVNLSRIVRTQVLSIKKQSYIEAIQAQGASHFRIIFKHIFPNMLGTILVFMTLQIPTNILYESFLSFVGLGIQPPYSSWGVLAEEGWRSLKTFPHLIVFPGLILYVTMLCLNIIGESLRDRLDPKLRYRE